MPSIDVACDGGLAEGWLCSVTLTDVDGSRSVHRVRVSPGDIARLAPGATEPSALVAASFEFLLEREPPSSILSAFDITVIGRYFPDYEATIRRRLGAG